MPLHADALEIFGPPLVDEGRIKVASPYGEILTTSGKGARRHCFYNSGLNQRELWMAMLL